MGLTASSQPYLAQGALPGESRPAAPLGYFPVGMSSGAAEPCCPRTLRLGAAGWEGAGTGAALVLIHQTTKPLCVTAELLSHQSNSGPQGSASMVSDV